MINNLKTIKIAVLGFGVVGSGTVELFHKNLAQLQKNANHSLSLDYILDIREFPHSPYAPKIVKSLDVILADKDVEIVVEAMGGLTPTYEFVKRCLESGRSVVSSNKELVAVKGAELLAIAKEKNVNFLFEGSVGGAIPIIRPMRQCLVANELAEIVGILNGTTNFILTKMICEKMSFKDALSLAQSLGYAERDPSADIEGHDACRKICILASLAFGRHVYPQYVHTEGISDITLEDVDYAHAWGGEIKLLGRVQKLASGKILPIVAPQFVPEASQLASVDDVFNAIMVKGDAIDKVMFYGRGAGKFPTASAMLSDVLEAIHADGTISAGSWEDSVNDDFIIPIEDMISARYVRATVPSNGEKETIEKIFGNIKYLSRPSQPDNEVAFVTEPQSEKINNQNIQAATDAGITILSTIRVLDCNWEYLI